MEIESKYPGKCATCGKPYKGRRIDGGGHEFKGDVVEWSKEGGTHHIACYNALPTLSDYFDANVLADALGFSKPGELPLFTDE